MDLSEFHVDWDKIIEGIRSNGVKNTKSIISFRILGHTNFWVGVDKGNRTSCFVEVNWYGSETLGGRVMQLPLCLGRIIASH